MASSVGLNFIVDNLRDEDVAVQHTVTLIDAFGGSDIDLIEANEICDV